MQIHFPGTGNVLEFYKIRKCSGKILPIKKIHLEQQQKRQISIMPVEENFDYRRKSVLVHSCWLKFK